MNPLKMIRSKYTLWHTLAWYSAWTRRNDDTWQCSVYDQTYLMRNSCEVSWQILLELIYYEMLVLKYYADNHWPDTYNSLCWNDINTVHQTVFTLASINPYLMSNRKFFVIQILISIPSRTRDISGSKDDNFQPWSNGLCLFKSGWRYFHRSSMQIQFNIPWCFPKTMPLPVITIR